MCECIRVCVCVCVCVLCGVLVVLVEGGEVMVWPGQRGPISPDTDS